MDSSNQGVSTRTHEWLKKPFTTDMDALHWFLFLGLVVVAAVLWSRILAVIVEAAKVPLEGI